MARMGLRGLVEVVSMVEVGHGRGLGRRSGAGYCRDSDCCRVRGSGVLRAETVVHLSDNDWLAYVGTVVILMIVQLHLVVSFVVVAAAAAVVVEVEAEAEAEIDIGVEAVLVVAAVAMHPLDFQAALTLQSSPWTLNVRMGK